jgi:hypothetical protein
MADEPSVRKVNCTIQRLGTNKKFFLCLVSSGLELMTLTQRKMLSRYGRKPEARVLIPHG